MWFLLVIACNKDNDKGGVDPSVQATLSVKEIVAAELSGLADSAAALADGAPEPDADGWSADRDPDAVADLRASWGDARDSYERVEGAIAVLFPDYDYAIDARYDHFLAEGADADLFDGEGVTGMHAIERILWADAIPDEVVAFEEGLDGYLPASFPQTIDQSEGYRDALAARLALDTEAMAADFEPLALDNAAAFRGVIGSMAEQYEKVALAATGEDESRYAQRTLADMRANLAGGRALFEAFTPWLEAEGGSDLNADVIAGFERVSAAYDSISGDALPPIPADWNPDAPSAEQLDTAYGQLFELLSVEADPTVSGSLVERMAASADVIGVAVSL